MTGGVYKYWVLVDILDVVCRISTILFNPHCLNSLFAYKMYCWICMLQWIFNLHSRSSSKPTTRSGNDGDKSDLHPKFECGEHPQFDTWQRSSGCRFGLCARRRDEKTLWRIFTYCKTAWYQQGRDLLCSRPIIIWSYHGLMISYDNLRQWNPYHSDRIKIHMCMCLIHKCYCRRAAFCITKDL